MNIAKVLKRIILQNVCERLLLNFVDIFFKSSLEMFQSALGMFHSV